VETSVQESNPARLNEKQRTAAATAANDELGVLHRRQKELKRHF